MADQPKRRVRNPDTFRERAQNAAHASAQPKKLGIVRKTLRLLFAPLGRAIKRAFTWKPLAILLKILKKVGRIIVPKYLRNSWQELKLVTWPSWKQSRQLTFAVLVFAVVFGAAIALVDFGLDKLFRHILLK